MIECLQVRTAIWQGGSHLRPIETKWLIELTGQYLWRKDHGVGRGTQFVKRVPLGAAANQR